MVVNLQFNITVSKSCSISIDRLSMVLIDCSMVLTDCLMVLTDYSIVWLNGWLFCQPVYLIGSFINKSFPLSSQLINQWFSPSVSKLRWRSTHSLWKRNIKYPIPIFILYRRKHSCWFIFNCRSATTTSSQTPLAMGINLHILWMSNNCMHARRMFGCAEIFPTRHEWKHVQKTEKWNEVKMRFDRISTIWWVYLGDCDFAKWCYMNI